MHTEGFEGFEGLEEDQRNVRRTYVSGNGQEEIDRLKRENEKLRKSLEKEQFFNKLLDQEIQELKANNPPVQRQYSDYWSGGRRVSKGAFYTLLFISLAMAAYIGYGIYYDKQFSYLTNPATYSPPTNDATVSEPVSPTEPAVSNSNTPSNTVETSGPGNASAQQSTTATPPTAPAIKDSVPNIIGTTKTNATAKPEVKQVQKAAVVAQPEDEYDEDEVNAVINEPVTRSVPIAPSPETKPIIGRYRVTSKANFYNSPDENSMRSTFISEAPNRIVEARDDRNGFVFVVYTNDLGFTSKGWLSKKDLAKAE
jgi:cytoskeletal protein RodZ